MDFMLNLRGKKHETDKKNITELAGKNHRNSDCAWHDFNRICCHLLEVVVFLDKFLNNCFIQPDSENL
jgi:hypothetical protein